MILAAMVLALAAQGTPAKPAAGEATHLELRALRDVGPPEQMSADVLAKPAHLFTPTVAFQYAQLPPASEPRAQRPWRVDGGPDGADIAYRLSSPVSAPPRVLIVNAAGDTVARLTGGMKAGINHVSWNFLMGAADLAAGGGRAGGGGGGGGGGGPIRWTER